MKHNSALIVGCLALVCLMAVSVQQVQAASGVTLVSHSMFYTSSNVLYVVGEVENTGDVATEFTKVNATFYDSENEVITTKVGYAEVDVLLPGKKSPFYVMLMEYDGSLDVESYELTVLWNESEETKEQVLEITSSSQSTDILDSLHVTGEIKNTGSTTATEVIVFATFYDSTGTVVGRSWEYAEPEDLASGQTGTFDVTLIYEEQIAKVASYSLTAESTEYAFIPEFPTWTPLAVALTFIAVTMVVYKKKLQTTE